MNNGLLSSSPLINPRVRYTVDVMFYGQSKLCVYVQLAIALRCSFDSNTEWVYMFHRTEDALRKQGRTRLYIFPGQPID